MATDTKGYRFLVTNAPQAEAQATFLARGAHDDWRINSEARVFAANMRGQRVWALHLMSDGSGGVTVYVTQQQAAQFGLCHCGAAAQYIGFEGLRCGAHSKGGMSYLCSTADCTNVSETGFSSHCKVHTSVPMREAREAYQAELRARATAPYRY